MFVQLTRLAPKGINKTKAAILYRIKKIVNIYLTKNDRCYDKQK